MENNSLLIKHKLQRSVTLSLNIEALKERISISLNTINDQNRNN